MNRTIVSFSFVLIVILIASGCSPDARELDHRSLIVGMGIDKAREEEGSYYSVSIQLPILRGEDTGPQAKEFEIFTAKGESIWDALAQLEAYTPTVLFFGHLKVVTVSEEVAREGLLPIIDFFDREPSIANKIQLMIVMNKDAKELIGHQSPLVSLPSLYLERFFRSNQKLSRSEDVKLFEYRRDSNAATQTAILPIIRILEDKLLIQNMALFKNHKMIDELDAKETGIVNLLKLGTQESKNKSITITLENGEKSKIAFQRMNLKAKFHLEKTFPLKVQIDVKGQAELVEKSAGETTAKLIKKAEEAVSRDFEKDIQETLTKLQEINADPIHLGQRIFARDQKYFDQLKWEKKGWQEAKISVHTEIQIDNTGQRGNYHKELRGR